LFIILYLVRDDPVIFLVIPSPVKECVVHEINLVTFNLEGGIHFSGVEEAPPPVKK
jgi:hypothetical protein